MRDIRRMSVMQIDVTNYCNKECSNCTRLIGHYRKDQLYFMDVEYFEKAVISLKTFNGIIGIIGGQPTLHPEFPKLCEILRNHINPINRRGLWSNYLYHSTYNNIIKETFGYFCLNSHSGDIFHTPILVSSESLVSDETTRQKYIEDCWIQNTWSGTINPNGGFFCEVAGAFSMLLDGIKGFDIEKEPDWWKRPISDFDEQKKWACDKCGAAIPLKPRKSSSEIDDISEDNYELLKEQSKKLERDKYELFKGTLDEKQKRDPSWYRTYYQDNFIKIGNRR